MKTLLFSCFALLVALAIESRNLVVRPRRIEQRLQLVQRARTNRLSQRELQLPHWRSG